MRKDRRSSPDAPFLARLSPHPTSSQESSVDTVPSAPLEYRHHPHTGLGAGHAPFQAGLGAWQSLEGAYCGGKARRQAGRVRKESRGGT